MQFAVPQFTDVEDKLIGPLTLKQFLVLLATGGLVFFVYSLLGLSFFFFIFALPITLIGVGLTFGTFNGRPLFGYFGALLNFISRPQTRVFKREDVIVSVSFKAEKKPKAEEVVSSNMDGQDESRLKKLAYLLDQKTAEEKELLINKK